MRVPRQVEDQLIEQGADQFAAKGCKQAAGGAEQAKFSTPGAPQQTPLGPQCPQQCALADAFSEGGLQPGKQHRQPGGQHKQQDKLDGQGDLREDAAQLRNQSIDLQQGDGGEGAGQRQQLPVLLGRQVETGQVGGGQVLQGAGLEDHVEVGLETVPVHLAQAGDLGIAVEAADVEAQAVAQFQLQAGGQFGFHRYAGQAIGRFGLPPVAGDQLIVCRQLGGPGQAQVTVEGTFAPRFLAHGLPQWLTINQQQTPRHHWVQRLRMGRERGPVGGESALFGRQNVQGEVIGGVAGQLVLPGVQQLAAQQGDQRHGQNDQAERQRLAGGGQWLAQQLTQTQAPAQAGIGQQASQAAQAQQQQAAKQQRRQQAAAQQGQGQGQI